MAWRISAILVTLALLGGCNTMHGMGQDFDSVFGTNVSGDHPAASGGNGTSTSTTGSTSTSTGTTTVGASGSASASSGSNGSAAH